jgi:pyruvate kinase
MNIARVNGAHGSLDDVKAMILRLQRDLPAGVEILLDLPGNKIRTDNILEPIPLTAGQEFVLKPENLTYRPLYKSLKKGDMISVADGTIRLEVTGVESEEVKTRVIVGGKLGNRKGVNVRGIHADIPFDFERDIALLNIAIETKIHYVGISFVRKIEHVRRVRAQFVGTGIKTIAKIETAESLEYIDKSLAEADLVMIDRGDLEADIGRENVPLTQKLVLRRAQALAVPVVVASQFLTSMMTKPLPFMAEVSDVANAVLDGAAILMLSEETAVGDYPFDCIATMKTVADTIEVTGIDASAIHSLTEIKQAADTSGARLVLVNLSPELRAALRKRQFIDHDAMPEGDFDRTLETCENAVIAAHAGEGAHVRDLRQWFTQALGNTTFAEELVAVCQRLEVRQGEIIASQGDAADRMHFMVEGRVGSIVRLDDGRSERVRSLGRRRPSARWGSSPTNYGAPPFRRRSIACCMR